MWARETAWLGFQWFRHQYVGSTFCNFGTYKTFDSLDRPDKNLRRRTCELYHKHWIKSFSISTKSFPCIQLADVFPSLSDQILAGFSIWYLVIISSWGTEEWRMMHLETAWDHRSYCSLLPLRPQHCAIPVLHFNKPGFFFQPSFVSGFLFLLFFFLHILMLNFINLWSSVRCALYLLSNVPMLVLSFIWIFQLFVFFSGGYAELYFAQQEAKNDFSIFIWAFFFLLNKVRVYKELKQVCKVYVFHTREIQIVEAL